MYGKQAKIGGSKVDKKFTIWGTTGASQVATIFENLRVENGVAYKTM